MENLVLSGGSIKGLTYIGVIKALYENINIFDKIKCFAGASAGSVFATLLYFKIPLENFENKFLTTDFSTAFELDIEDLLEKYGLDNGSKMMSLFINCLGEYQNFTFKEAYEKTGKRLVISGTCLNDYTIEYFDYLNHPNLKIIKAIRISCSIPLLFTAESINDKIYIDGATLEPLPLSIFPKEKTLGVWIVDKNPCDSYHGDLSNLEGYIYNLMMCIRERLVNLHDFDNKYDILKIELENVNFLEFDMTLQKKKEIVQIGYNTIKLYLDNLE